MTKSKVENILGEIQKYKKYDFTKLIEERLDKTLNKYVEDLEDAGERLRYKRIITVMKGLNK